MSEMRRRSPPTSDHERMDTRGHNDRKRNEDVSKSNGTEQPQWTPAGLESSLCHVRRPVLSHTALNRVGRAGVTNMVVDEMFLRDSVKYSETGAVLEAFSQHVGATWTIDAVSVPVLLEGKKDETSEDEHHD